MSYQTPSTSKDDYGIVKIGDFINVSEDGIISSPEIISGAGITVNYAADFITISATGADLIHVYGTTTNYTTTEEDEYIGVSSASAVIITLPSNAFEGRVYTIKDEYGQGSGKITIQPSDGELLDKKSSYVIGIPFQSVSVVYRNGGWWII